MYFNLIDPIIKKNKKATIEEIEEKIRKEFKMKGLILADINIIKKMDKKLTTGNSDIIPVYIDKSGEISLSKSKVVTKEEFSEMQNKLEEIIKEISKEIMSGKINAEPHYYKKTKCYECKYCTYKGICYW